MKTGYKPSVQPTGPRVPAEECQLNSSNCEVPGFETFVSSSSGTTEVVALKNAVGRIHNQIESFYIGTAVTKYQSTIRTNERTTSNRLSNESHLPGADNQLRKILEGCHVPDKYKTNKCFSYREKIKCFTVYRCKR